MRRKQQEEKTSVFLRLFTELKFLFVCECFDSKAGVLHSLTFLHVPTVRDELSRKLMNGFWIAGWRMVLITGSENKIYCGVIKPYSPVSDTPFFGPHQQHRKSMD